MWQQTRQRNRPQHQQQTTREIDLCQETEIPLARKMTTGLIAIGPRFNKLHSRCLLNLCDNRDDVRIDSVSILSQHKKWRMKLSALEIQAGGYEVTVALECLPSDTTKRMCGGCVVVAATAAATDDKQKRAILFISQDLNRMLYLFLSFL
jgi:hypothetical protein